MNRSPLNTSPLNSLGTGSAYGRPGNLRPVAIGRPSLGMACSVAGLSPAEVGALGAPAPTDTTAPVPGLRPVRVGRPASLKGQPPPSAILYVEGLSPTKIGSFAIGAANIAPLAAGLAPVRLGDPVARLSFAVAGLAPVSISPVGAVRHTAAASGLRPVSIGLPRIATACAVAGWRPVRVGMPATLDGGVSCAIEGLSPVSIGSPSRPGWSARVGSLRPVRIGTPRLERGSIC